MTVILFFFRFAVFADYPSSFILNCEYHVHKYLPRCIISVMDLLEAFGERRPPWPRQVVTPILSNIKMLSLGGERLTPKVLDHYLRNDRFMLPLLWCFLLIYASSNTQFTTKIQSVLQCTTQDPSNKISSQSIHNFVSNVVHKQINKQTNKQTNQRYQKHNLLW